MADDNWDNALSAWDRMLAESADNPPDDYLNEEEWTEKLLEARKRERAAYTAYQDHRKYTLPLTTATHSAERGREYFGDDYPPPWWWERENRYNETMVHVNRNLFNDWQSARNELYALQREKEDFWHDFEGNGGFRQFGLESEDDSES